MVNEQNVRDAITSVVASVDAAAVPFEDEFVDAGIDSLDHAYILLELQENYGLIVPDEALEECSSIQGILAFAKRMSG